MDKPLDWTQEETTQTRYQNFGVQALLLAINWKRGGFGPDKRGPIPILYTDEQMAAAQGVLNLLEPRSVHSNQTWFLHLHQLFKVLFFTVHPRVDVEADQDPTAVLLMLINLRKHSGNFSDVGLVGAGLAGLTHTMRLVAAKDILDKREDDGRPDALVL